MDLLKSSGLRRGRSVALLVAGVLAGSVLIQPAVAHVTKKVKHLYKHLDPRYYNVGEKVGDANTLDGVDSTGYLKTAQKAADADKLDNLDSSAFQQEADLLYAVVDDAGVGSVTILRSRGTTGVSTFFITAVGFNRPINNCAWFATPEPESTGVAIAATVSLGADNSTVNVSLWDAGGALVFDTDERFHLQVLC